MVVSYKQGKGKAGREEWGLFFNDRLNEPLVDRIKRLTRWREDSLADKFADIWSALCGRLHDKRRPEDYQEGRDRVTISQSVLNPEQCLACAALLYAKNYPLEIVPPMVVWEEELRRAGERNGGSI